ncbi:MAG: hypothetical protein AB7G28_26110 [Pirellulales bacterium]
MARRIRIAASVFFGVLTVALCMLWGRSYRHEDELVRVSRQGYFARDFRSVYGILACSINWNDNDLGPRQNWCFFTQEVRTKDDAVLPPPEHHWILDYRSSSGFHIRCPHWFVALACGVMSGILSRQWQIRFSLRTLLIATTLVAVVLGISVVF